MKFATEFLTAEFAEKPQSPQRNKDLLSLTFVHEKFRLSLFYMKEFVWSMHGNGEYLKYDVVQKVVR